VAAHIADVDVTAVASQYIGSSFCYFSDNYSPSPAAALNLSHCVISLSPKRHDFPRICKRLFEGASFSPDDFIIDRRQLGIY
jgi:hypothetical protein